MDTQQSPSQSKPEAGDTNRRISRLPQRSSSLIRIAIVGLAMCLGIFAVDIGVLELARFVRWQGVPVYLVFAVFIIQTAILGGIVGIKVKREPIWWLFFGWMLALVNLVLILVKFNSFSWTHAFQSAFVYAFLTAQMGLVIFWGILDSTVWRRRFPIAFFLLIACSYPYWFFVRDRKWLSVMTCYLISVSATSIVLRLWRFRLGSKEGWKSLTQAGRLDQFGIKHLFIWTTIVAVLFGIGRLIPWAAIATTFLNQSAVLLMTRALLMTMIIVVTAWTVLGESRGAWLRGLVLVGLLFSVGFGLSYIEQRTRPSGLVGWRLTTDEIRRIWFVWTTLNGLFLAGLMLVIRLSGSQLARIEGFKKITSATDK